MKKALVFILVLCMILALAACGTPATTIATPTPEGGATGTENTAEPSVKVDWPKKNVKIIVGYGAGGDTDLAARIIADAMSNKLGVSVIVENLSGGTGVVGRSELLVNDADGYTLMFDQFGSPITQVLMGNATYTIEEAGTPVCAAGVSALALCVSAKNAQGIETMDDLIAYAKDHPGELTYSTPGQFTFAHLAALSAFDKIGIELTSVSTDGTSTAVTEVLGNHVNAICVPYSGIKQYVESGDMILLGLSGPSAFAPDDSPVLTAYGADEIYTWYSLWAPNGMDSAVSEAISAAVGECLADEAVMKRMTDINIEVDFQDYTAFQDVVTEYRDIIKNALVAGGALAE